MNWRKLELEHIDEENQPDQPNKAVVDPGGSQERWCESLSASDSTATVREVKQAKVELLSLTVVGDPNSMIG